MMLHGPEEYEEWRPVVGYEGYYEVSNLGKVKSLDRIVNSKNGIMLMNKISI
jgi:hypothetical protein